MIFQIIARHCISPGLNTTQTRGYVLKDRLESPQEGEAFGNRVRRGIWVWWVGVGRQRALKPPTPVLGSMIF